MTVTPIGDRYVEYVVNDDHDDWICIKDRATGKSFVLGSCPREIQLHVLKALNFADQHMDKVA